MARKTVKTMAQQMAVSGKEPAVDVLDDTSLVTDPIISAIQSIRLVVDDLQFNDIDDNSTNSAKTGISSGQTSAITANTAKTGISSAQANAITANSACCETNNLSKTDGKVISCTVLESRGSYSLVFTMVHGEVTKAATIALR